MKKLNSTALKFALVACITFIASMAFGQTTYTYRDSVCANSQDVMYGVTNPNPNSTYHWTLSGGGTLDTNYITVGADTLVQVDWASTSGTFTLSVIEQNEAGCFGDTVQLEIFVNETPEILALEGDSVCANGVGGLMATLSGAGPWVIDYTDGTNTYTDTATVSPWSLTLPAYSGTTTIEITGLTNTNTGCAANLSAPYPSANIYVYPKPSTGAIFHY